ncbi:MAG: hypothetical protein OEY14_05665, partial [Myxococcales bacterium]|nr:hypothetical protein [Myxococcales bacterium]
LRHALRALSGLALLGACASNPPGGAPSSPARTAASAPADAEGVGWEDVGRARPEAGPAAPAPAPASRSLARTSSFAQLVLAASALEQAGLGDSEAGCLLGLAPTGFRLEADLAGAVRPLPEAPEELDSRLDAGEGIRLLSRWSVGGAGSLVLVPFTTSPPTGPSVRVLALTSLGLRLGRAGARPDWSAPRPAAQVRELLEGAASEGGGVDPGLVITAEAAIPVSELVALLGRLDAGLEVSLAVALPEGTRLPASAPPRWQALCPSGLPEAEGALGGLEAAPIRAALRAAEPNLLRCAALAGPSPSLRMEVAFRVGAGGEVTQACVIRDDRDVPAARACVVEHLRELRFPDPGGWVDVHLPLSLAPEGSLAQRARCAP